MPINQYFNYQPLQREDYSFKAPLEMMGKTLAYLQDKSDKNYAALDAVPSMLNVPVLEEDAQNRANVENKYRERIKQIVDKTGGDYSNVHKDVLSIQNDLRKDLSFSGSLGAMKSNYDDINDYSKTLKDNKTLKDYERYAAMKTVRANFAKNGGTGIIDPLTGKYNRVSRIDIDGFDRAKFLNDIKEIKPISEEEVTTYMQNNYIIDRTKGREGVTRQRAYDIAKADLRSNENYQQYIRQMKSVGIDLSAQDEENALQAFASERSYSKTKDDLKRTFDHNLIFNEDRRHHAVMEKNTAPQLQQPTPTLNLPMTIGEGLNLDAKIGDKTGLTPVGSQLNAQGSIFGGAYSPVINSKEKVAQSNLMDFNHPSVVQDKTGIFRQAMDISGNALWERYKLDNAATLPANQKNLKWNAIPTANKNDILGAMYKDAKYKSSLESGINNNYSTLARYYNNSSNQGASIYSNDEAVVRGESMKRESSVLPTYEANGTKSDKTLQRQISEFETTNKVKNAKIVPVATPYVSNLEGYTFSSITGQDENGVTVSKELYVKDDNTRAKQWGDDFAGWNKNKTNFAHNGKAYTRVQSGNIYNTDGSAASSYSIAKPHVSDPNDIAGTLFTNNMRDMKIGATMGSLGDANTNGELLGYTVKHNKPVAVFEIDGQQQYFFVRELSEQAKVTTQNSADVSNNAFSNGAKKVNGQRQ